MPAGLQVFGADGVLEIDLGQRTGRILGKVTSGVVAGAITVPEFSQGIPFYTVSLFNPGVTIFGPAVTISGTTLSWDFGFPSRESAIITYGVR